MIIPNSVTSIGDSAFSGCSSLTSVTIPNSVTSIGNSAFENCWGLKSVTIGNSVTSIGDYAFYDCSGLKSVTIPNSVTSIGRSAFSGCTALTGIQVDPNNLNFSATNGVLFNKDQSILVQYPAGKPDVTYVIPNSVTSIGDYAFSECSGLTSMTIPNSVTSIGRSAFSGCNGLTSITIPSGVFGIEQYAPWGSNANIIRVDSPAIASQPTGAIVNLGGSANFSVTATGTDLSYQWKKNGENILNATGATLNLSNVQASDAADYTVSVSNAVGSVTSETAGLQVLAGGIGAWANGYTLSDGDELPNADPDKDGLNNALEYVLGGDPTQNDAVSLAPSAVKSGSNFIFSFKRSLAAKSDPNTRIAVEYSSNLTVWASYPIGADSSGSVVITPYDSTSDSIVVTIPMANAPLFFARLNVTVTDSVSP